ncbi:TatD family hydrolase [bacterium]|jgi:TatD DNase family protein|nr:TatD family hydrolase [bacterium]
MSYSTKKLIDSHAHIYMCEESTEKLANESLTNGIQATINVGIDLVTSQQVIKDHILFPSLKPTAGIHPCSTPDISPDDLHHLDSIAVMPGVVAIGETGLDYYWEPYDKAKQELFFRYQLDLGQKLNLPVVIHNRRADDDIIRIVKEFPSVKKVFHCFSCGPSVYEKLNHENHYFSFTGNITYSTKGKTIQALKKIPIQKIMIETDSPYLTPKSFSGQKNKPVYVKEVVKKIAFVKEIEESEVIRQTTTNALSFFNLTN